ncbi:MAG: hypothetical protein M1820_010204 [Bogoriella megaspora]|nr:MAG: hypothetical protein M1820_010204 [Bogoriella megaspora]
MDMQTEENEIVGEDVGPLRKQYNLFLGAFFTTIFTPALRGLGRNTKRDGSFIVPAISGAAIFPHMTGAIATKYCNFHHAMAIPVAAYVTSYVFPVYIYVVNKHKLDEHGTTDLNVTAEKQIEGIVSGKVNEEATTEQVEFVP